MPRAIRRLTPWLVALASLAATANAQTPRINGVSPLGVCRGTKTSIGIIGRGLTGRPRLIAPFGFRAESPSEPSKGAERWDLTLEVERETAIGVHLIRVQTEEGLSNPFPLAVGQFDQVSEVEENSRFELAQRVSTPCVVEGKAAGTDVDFFRFAGKKGQRIVVDAQCARLGTKVDPSIRLTSADRKLVAAADDSPGLLTDARLIVSLPEDGDYIVELFDSRYKGGDSPAYRLLIGALFVAEEIYPLGGRRGEAIGFELRGGTLTEGRTWLGVARAETPVGLDLFQPRLPVAMLGLDAGETAGVRRLDLDSPPWLAVGEYPEIRESNTPEATPVAASPPVVLNGRIEARGDEDLFPLRVSPGARYRFDVSASDLGSALDGVLQIRNPAGSVLASADDTKPLADSRMQGRKATSFVSPDPSLEFTVPSDTPEVVVAIKDLRGEGGIGFPYRITVEPVSPTFDLALTSSELSLPRGGSAVVGVAVLRRGYNGPIGLDIGNAPAGLLVRPGAIAEGATVGSFTVAAPVEITIDRADLRVQGRGAVPPNGPVVNGIKLLSFSAPDEPASLAFNQVGLPTAIASASPLGFEIAPGPLELAHGHGLPIPIKVHRPPGPDMSSPLAIAAAPLPPGWTIPAATIAEGASDGVATVIAGIEAPLGRTSVVLTAKGKLGGRERTLVLPAVLIDVVRPASVVASGLASLKPGETIEIRGRVERKPPFAGPVTVRLDALPAGLTFVPESVPPDRAEFNLKLVAGADAPVATGAARLVAAFQVDKKDYPPVVGPIEIRVVPR